MQDTNQCRTDNNTMSKRAESIKLNLISWGYGGGRVKLSDMTPAGTVIEDVQDHLMICPQWGHIIIKWSGSSSITPWQQMKICQSCRHVEQLQFPIRNLLKQNWIQKRMSALWFSTCHTQSQCPVDTVSYTAHMTVHCPADIWVANVHPVIHSGMPTCRKKSGFVREQHYWCAKVCCHSKVWSCLRNALVTISSGKPPSLPF